jgi:hypothetical protein
MNDAPSRSAPAGLQTTTSVLVDAHVHLHDCFAPREFLAAAAANMAAAARALALPAITPGFLLFTESSGADAFSGLANGALATGEWRIERLPEAVSLRATAPNRPPLGLIGGRQIVTAEKLEVLALGTRETFPDGEPIKAVLAAVDEAGAIAVVPWGFGKWIGRRGRILLDILQAQDEARVHLGDNGGRPVGWPRPPPFAIAESRGRRVLPGTDPLPFAVDVAKPGRYGFVADLALDWSAPFVSLKRGLEACDTVLKTYGRRENPVGFVARQVAMQIVKRQRRRLTGP